MTTMNTLKIAALTLVTLTSDEHRLLRLNQDAPCCTSQSGPLLRVCY